LKRETERLNGNVIEERERCDEAEECRTNENGQFAKEENRQRNGMEREIDRIGMKTKRKKGKIRSFRRKKFRLNKQNKMRIERKQRN
jgi:hypothetical protein